jgi:hypothetical protein
LTVSRSWRSSWPLRRVGPGRECSVDSGAPFGIAKTVGTGGSVSDGGSRGVTGYSIVAADSLDAAVGFAKGCPVLEVGGAVDVYEALAM